MKTSRHHRRRRRVPITTMKELQAEKFRLQREINGTEEGIKHNYRSLVDALTFRNLLTTVADEIVATNFVVSQAYSIIRPLFKRIKKRKSKARLEREKPKVRARKTIKRTRKPKSDIILKKDTLEIKKEG